MTMLSYHNKPELKAERIARIQEHRRQERLLQSHGYWHDGKGCAVGCTVEKDDDPHVQYEIEMGIPQALARLEDVIFESLSVGDAQAWPERFLEAIPVGKDLSFVWHRFAAWLLIESGLLTITDINREVIEMVAKLHQRAAKGEIVDAQEWSAAARSAARSAESAAAWSAESAARSAAAWSAAARSAAWSAAARSAALSAARSAAESAESAESAAWKKMAEKLLEILASA